MEDSLLERWKDLLWRAAATDALAYAGVMKIVTNLEFDIPAHLLMNPGFNYDYFNYSNTNKHRQLERNYWDPVGAEAMKAKLRERAGKSHSSVALQLNGQKKDSRSQGFCMQSMVITRTPGYSEVIIYYRSTELIKKFMADLLFFSKQLAPIFEELGIQPSYFRFRFANAYLSSEFMPLLARVDDRPVSFFRHLELHDTRFFRSCVRAILTYSDPRITSSYASRNRMLRYYRKHMPEERTIPLVKYLRRRRKAL